MFNPMKDMESGKVGVPDDDNLMHKILMVAMKSDQGAREALLDLDLASQWIISRLVYSRNPLAKVSDLFEVTKTGKESDE